MGGSSAMLALVVREALAQVAAPEVAKLIESTALESAGLREFPDDGAALARFVAGAVLDTVIEHVGEDAAESVRRDLEPIFLSFGASLRAPESVPVMEYTDFPVSESMTAPPSSSAAPPQSAASREREAGAKSRVLVADNNAEVVATISAALRDAGYDVETATDGYVALELCQSAHMDVVVADLHMPAISGRQLIQTIDRTMGRDAPPVILITGNVFAPTNIDGAAEVMRKPLDMEELTTAIELAVWDHAAGL